MLLEAGLSLHAHFSVTVRLLLLTRHFVTEQTRAAAYNRPAKLLLHTPRGKQDG